MDDGILMLHFFTEKHWWLMVLKLRASHLARYYPNMLSSIAFQEVNTYINQDRKCQKGLFAREKSCLLDKRLLALKNLGTPEAVSP